MKPKLLPALLLLAAAAAAQTPPPAAPAPAPEKSILEAELEPPPGGYVFNPQGRRDPFVSLIRPVGPQGGKVRPQGLPGLLIQEVALKGIVRTQGGGLGSATSAGYIGVLQDTQGKSHFVNVGQRLFDGVIVAIDASSVTFRQEVTDPLSPVRTRDVRKTLYPSEEARQ